MRDINKTHTFFSCETMHSKHWKIWSLVDNDQIWLGSLMFSNKTKFTKKRFIYNPT